MSRSCSESQKFADLLDRGDTNTLEDALNQYRSVHSMDEIKQCVTETSLKEHKNVGIDAKPVYSNGQLVAIEFDEGILSKTVAMK